MAFLICFMTSWLIKINLQSILLEGYYTNITVDTNNMSWFNILEIFFYLYCFDKLFSTYRNPVHASKPNLCVILPWGPLMTL